MEHSPQVEAIPAISIVIPVCGRLELLQALLTSIEEAVRQQGQSECEVIVVWDGNAAPEAVVVPFEQRSGIAARSIFAEAGPAWKRNLGIAAARHPIVLCVDSDCTIHPELISTLAVVFADANVHAATVPVLFDEPQGWLQEAAATMPYRTAFTWAAASQAQWWAPAATIALRRRTVEQLGGFWSTGTGMDRGEDVDLGLRWTTQLAFPAVIACSVCPSRHARETWRAWSLLERAWRFGGSKGMLWRRHPAFRRLKLPQLAIFGPLCLMGFAVSWAIEFPAVGLGVLGIGFILVWFLLLSGWLVCKRQLRWIAIPAGLLQIGIFDLASTLSLWRAGAWTSGLWFHPRQPEGEWPVLAVSGWLALALGAIVAMVGCFQ